jgi:hypothetical protein
MTAPFSRSFEVPLHRDLFDADLIAHAEVFEHPLLAHGVDGRPAHAEQHRNPGHAEQLTPRR